MTDYTDPTHDRRAPQPPAEIGWHLDKKVPLSLIAAMVAQVVVVTMFFADIKRDVELLKADNATLHKADDTASGTLRDSVSLFNAQLARIDTKLDRLIERAQK